VVDKLLLQKGVALLAMREHSKAELKRKLASKTDVPDEVDAVLDALLTQGLQSDARFVESFVRSYTNRGLGPLRIAEMLRTKGVEETLIREQLPRDEDYWRTHLQAVWQKKYHGELPKNRNEKARQLRFLQSRGFAVGMIMHLLDGVSD